MAQRGSYVIARTVYRAGKQATCYGCAMSRQRLGGAAPHPPLPDYYGDDSARRSWVRDIFNRTADDYDRIEAAMSAGSGARYRYQALLRAGLRPGMQVL